LQNGFELTVQYVISHHTGAGLSDATFVRNASEAATGFLNATNTSTPNAPNYIQEFDFGTEFPWYSVQCSNGGGGTQLTSICRGMYMALSDTAYSGWQPVRIDSGYGGSSSRGLGEGFFINSTGLQWSSNAGADPAIDSFSGWIICDWWHGVPQLFFRLASYDLPLPASCAEIYLRPEYI
jgi:hypothetical protein